MTSTQPADPRREYVLLRERTLDTTMLDLCHPRDRDVLVFGCGLGNEVLWCARHGARSVVGIDLAPPRYEPLASLMEERGFGDFDYSLHQCDVHDLAIDHPGRYDLVVSNGVFEHVSDLKGVLNAFRPLLRHGGRIAIYVDAMWFSSTGGHLGMHCWEHLWMTREEIKTAFPGRWPAFTARLNRITAVDFLQAIRDVGALVMQFKTRRDPYLSTLPPLLDLIRSRQQVSPTDMSITAIACELCFVEHL